MLGEGFLLGLSSGVFCIMYCAPVIMPYLFSEDASGKHGSNAKMISLFMLGRLAGYIIVGAILGITGAFAYTYLDPSLKRKLSAIALSIIGLVMILSGIIHNFPKWSACRKLNKAHKPNASALVLGLLTGLNLCPPFFAAASRVVTGESVFGGIAYFFFFFLGTSVFILPLFGVPFLKGKHMSKIRMVARMSLILLGGYFLLFLGIFRLF